MSPIRPSLQRSFLIAVCGFTAACGLDRQQSAPGLLVGEGIALWSESRGGRSELVVGTAEPRQAIARLAGVRLVLGLRNSRDEIHLPFADIHSRAGLLEARCNPRDGHSITVTFGLTEPDTLRVEFHDRIAERSDILEATLDYEALPGSQFEEVWLPHRQRIGQLVGDVSWHVPLAYVRSGNRSFGLSPDAEQLSRQRRLPQGLEVLGNKNVVRYGLIRYREDPSTQAFVRDRVSALPVRGEDLRFVHYINVSDEAKKDTTLHELLSRQFDRYALWDLTNNDTPLHRPAAATIDKSLARLDQSWHTMETATGRVGTLAQGWAAASHGFPAVDGWFTIHSQLLQTAHALAARADGDAAASQQVEAMIDLLLQAPARSGLFPTVIALDRE